MTEPEDQDDDQVLVDHIDSVRAIIDAYAEIHYGDVPAWNDLDKRTRSTVEEIGDYLDTHPECRDYPEYQQIAAMLDQISAAVVAGAISVPGTDRAKEFDKGTVTIWRERWKAFENAQPLQPNGKKQEHDVLQVQAGLKWPRSWHPYIPEHPLDD